jgi:hypothetical protein
MVERALKLRQALHNFTSSDRDLNNYVLSDNEWIFINEIHLLMQVCKL